MIRQRLPLPPGCGWFMPIKYAGQAVAAPRVHESLKGLT